MKPLVSVIVLNFNSEKKTEYCLKSLNNLEYPSLNIIIVDNSTNKESTSYVKSLAKFYSNDFIELNENNGYAAGNRAGVDLALKKQAKYILILNNDTIVDPYCVSNMVNVMEEDSSIAISGPVLFDLEYENEFYKKTNNIQSYGLRINPYTGRTLSNKANLKDILSEHPIISGAALMIRDDIIKEFGFMNEDFFLYYEETDYCMYLKGKNPNIKICTANNAFIWHESSNNVDNKVYSLYYSHRNKIIFMRKHYTKTFPLFLCFLFFFSIPKKILKSRNKLLISALIKATKDGLNNLLDERI